jgi:hypothetical protein
MLEWNVNGPSEEITAKLIYIPTCPSLAEVFFVEGGLLSISLTAAGFVEPLLHHHSNNDTESSECGVHSRRPFDLDWRIM